MSVKQENSESSSSDSVTASVNHIKTIANYNTSRLQHICKKIYEAQNLDDILVHLKDEIASYFKAERLTIYYVDGIKRELISRFKSGNEISEIRVPIMPESIAGYVATKIEFVNISNVYDDDELKGISPDLKFDRSWDQKTGFVTRQVMAYPIIYKTLLMGVIQLINHQGNRPFSKNDEGYVKELGKIIGVALFRQKSKQKRLKKGKSGKYDYLFSKGHLDTKTLHQAIRIAEQRKVPLEQVLIKDLDIAKQEIGESLSRHYKLPYQEYYESIPIPGELLQGIKVTFMKKNCWVPLRTEDEKVVVAIDNPHDLQRVSEIESLFPGRTISFRIAFAEDIQHFINLFTKNVREQENIDEILKDLEYEDSEIEEAEDFVDEQSSAVVKLVNQMILDAYDRNASDIHIEPGLGKQPTEVRLRVDGSCMLYQTIPFNFRNAVASRIKIMSDLDIAERRKPQDGKIKFKKYSGLDIELRVATVPTQGNVEDIVMRILAAGEPIPLKKIGFTTRNYERFLQYITQPYGIIFVCGPTGSGKTTTLHSALSYINKPETKIWTAEDPVEITQKGLRQVQVNPRIGFTFEAAMRSFLRADPDVIMVGEMRDRETTSIGIEASLTGHLVLSTLHTNSAPESVTRLLDMGMDPFNFADAVLCILAQRLVRTLCKHCKASYHPSRKEYDELVREYGEKEFEQNLNIAYTDELMLCRPVGCDKCHNTGYAGRMGLHELLSGTDEMKKLIQQKSRMEMLRTQAIKDGMTTLKQDGIEKIFDGYCDLLQVRRVCIK
jgi:type II secretory ATPase GspE/PulE/Tfp pilus assembly ATPase PilB-like protein